MATSWHRIKKLRDDALAYYHADARRAEAIARSAIELAAETDDPRARGWGHRALAESCLFAGRMRESDRAYRDASDAFLEAGDEATLGQLLVGHVHVLSYLGDHEAAVATAERARRLLRRAGDDVYLAKLSMNLGSVHAHRERPRDALREYDRAARILRRRGPADDTLLGLEMNRGVALTQLDRHQDALSAFGRIIDAGTADDHPLLSAQARMNAAYVHGLRAEIDLALEAHAIAGNAFREHGHPKLLGSCLLGRAELYNQLNLHDRAAELAREATTLFGREGLSHDAALAELELAIAALGRGDLPAAASSASRARQGFRKAGSPAHVGFVDLLRAEVDQRAGRRERAIERARAASRTFRALSLRRWEGRAVVLLARLRAPGSAARLVAQARILDATAYPLVAFETWETLGALHERRGRTAEARKAYLRAAELLDRTRTRIPTEESKLAFLGDKSTVRHRLVRLALDRGRPRADELFSLVESAKAQALVDRLREPGHLLQAPGATTTRRSRAARRDLSWLHTRLARLELEHPDRTDEIDGLRTRLGEAEAHWSRLTAEQAEETASRPAGGEGSGADLEATRDRLPRGFGFLSWFVNEERSSVVAFTREGTRWLRLPDDLHARLDTLADRLDFLWAASSMTAVREAHPAAPTLQRATAPDAGAVSPARRVRLRTAADQVLAELHALVWTPIRELGLHPSRGWIVSPHGPIHRLPLGALLGPEGYVALSTEIVLTPSAGAFLETGRRRSSRGRRRAYVAGVPSDRLPGIAPEIAAVSRSLTGWDVTTDDAPTRERFLAATREARLVHIAAHGALRVDNPAYSFLELTDGPFYVHDLAGCRLGGATVVLTACSSARGVASAGDEWLGMARGFLRAGATTVVGSLWPIHDRATTRFAGHFYAHLADGTSTSRALQSAVREELASGRPPWEWGAFAHYGGTP